MRNTFFKVAAVMVCLCAAPVSAGSNLTSFQFLAHIDGVDAYGCPSCYLGTDTYFNATINTRNGNYTGVARGCVTNCSGCPQSYINGCVASISSGDVVICKSLYLVSRYGNAVLCASGNLYASP